MPHKWQCPTTIPECAQQVRASPRSEKASGNKEKKTRTKNKENQNLRFSWSGEVRLQQHRNDAVPSLPCRIGSSFNGARKPHKDAACT